MKRYARILLLTSQHVLEYKSRAFVWFLITLLNASLYLLFWRGALGSEGTNTWSFPIAVSYYLLLIVVGAFLHVHVDEEVAFDDIQRGGLAKYLTRPFSYFRIKFLEELPWRFIQAIFGAIIFTSIILLGIKFPLVSTPPQILLALCILILGYILTFIYKMIIGLSAFWMTDYSGLHNMEAITFILLGGFIIPLDLLPSAIRPIALGQPIAYMIYYPVISLQGMLSLDELVRIISTQIIWIVVGALAYQYLWHRGLRRFTAVGQ